MGNYKIVYTTMKTLKPGFQFINSKEILLKETKSIVLMGDTGCTSLSKETKKNINKILAIKTDLFIILGDLVQFGKDEEYNGLIKLCNKKTKVPIFALCGNHDLPNYRKFPGMPSYSLILDNYVIAVLNNPFAKFEKKDLKFLKDKLSKYKNKKFILLFHIPPPTDLYITHMKEEKWAELKNILDPHKQRIKYIFTGHIHGFREYYLNGYHVFITGGGGAKMQNLEKDKLKKHHALNLNLDKDAEVNICTLDI